MNKDLYFCGTKYTTQRFRLYEDKNPSWKGGISHNYLTRISDYSKPCEVCNTTDKKRDIHHIDKDRKNNQLDNLIIVCRSCHMKEHVKNQWSREYSQCIKCETKEIKHEGKGLCNKCYGIKREEYNLRNKEKIKQYKKEYWEKNKEKRKLYDKEKNNA